MICTEGKILGGKKTPAFPKVTLLLLHPSWLELPEKIFLFWLLIPCRVGCQADSVLFSLCSTLQYQIQTERQRIQTEFNQLRRILDSEEQRELEKLEEEEKKTLEGLAEAEDELLQQTQLLKELISDLERRSEWSTMELLQVKRVIQSEIIKTQSKLPSLPCP